MDVVIINRELNREKQFQIMYQSGAGFNHVYAGNLLTLEQAKALCEENHFNIVAIGTIWQCIK